MLPTSWEAGSKRMFGTPLVALASQARSFGGARGHPTGRCTRLGRRPPEPPMPSRANIPRRIPYARRLAAGRCGMLASPPGRPRRGAGRMDRDEDRNREWMDDYDGKSATGRARGRRHRIRGDRPRAGLGIVHAGGALPPRARGLLGMLGRMDARARRPVSTGALRHAGPRREPRAARVRVVDRSDGRRRAHRRGMPQAWSAFTWSGSRPEARSRSRSRSATPRGCSRSRCRTARTGAAPSGIWSRGGESSTRRGWPAGRRT